MVCCYLKGKGQQSCHISNRGSNGSLNQCISEQLYTNIVELIINNYKPVHLVCLEELVSIQVMLISILYDH